jgi:hypothetical protein
MKKILILKDSKLSKNGLQLFKMGISEPHIQLEAKYPGEYSIDFINSPKNLESPYDMDFFNKYDYIVFTDYFLGGLDETINLLKTLKKNNGVKSIYYCTDYWNMPSYYGDVYKAWNENKLFQKFAKMINLASYIITPGPIPLVNELKTAYYLPDLPIFPEIKNIPTDKPRIGVVPAHCGYYNMCLLKDIHKYIKKDLMEHMQFVLNEFTVKDISAGETLLAPKDTTYAMYERFLTDDYKICSLKYKEFLLKYLPNDKYDGDLDKEPYRRVWESEYKEDEPHYNILLAPKIKSKVNRLRYDYLEAALSKVHVNNKPFQIITSVNYSGNNVNKKIAHDIKASLQLFGQKVIFDYEVPIKEDSADVLNKFYKSL